jgi:hypothetical protein
MLSYSIIVRLPSGTEYWYAAKPPEVGDSILRHGTQYVVTACDESDDQRLVVTLEETVGILDSHPAHP